MAPGNPRQDLQVRTSTAIQGDGEASQACQPSAIPSSRAAWSLAALLAIAALIIAGLGSGSRLALANGTVLDTMTTPEGVTINVYVNTVTAQQVHDWLLANGLQAQVGLQTVNVVDTG